MRADIIIVGQGLAGTVLGWELERTGIPFEIVDAGHDTSASRIAAGIINPITGRRLVKSWQVDALLTGARGAFLELGAALGANVWHDLRVRRLFADDRERRVFAEKQARGELAPFASAADSDGFWIERAGRVDLPVLLSMARMRWIEAGILRQERFDWAAGQDGAELVIDCTGAASSQFDFVPWEVSKGEILTVAVEGLDPRVILNRGHWVCPLGLGVAKVGATHEPGQTDTHPTGKARVALEASATTMLGRPFAVSRHEAGVRVNLPDRRPIVGRHPSRPRLGIFNALGSKGALLAPWLARQWVNHLTEAVPFEPSVDSQRFWQLHSSQTSSH